ncbi:MFS transporter [Candidatus Uhrbacteria bacterium]|nr:MFS transporter [Candidatus Uhrbacteria bacterium]
MQGTIKLLGRESVWSGGSPERDRIKQMENPTKKIPGNVLILGFVALASGLGQDLITPVLPAYLTLLGVSTAGIGLIDGILQGATSFFRFVSGMLSDRYQNRKRFVFLGYALSSIARPLLALAGAFVPIAFLRTVDGMGKGMKDAPRDALVADSTNAKAHGRAFGFHRLVDTAGSILGPLLAGMILLLLTPTLGSYRTIFALSAIPGAATLCLIWFGIREKSAPTRQRLAGLKRLPWTFWIFTLGTAVAMLTKVNDSLFLLRAQGAGVSLAWIPFLFAGFTLVYAACAYPIGTWSDKRGKLPFIATGWLFLGGVELLLSTTTTVPLMLGAFVFYGLFYALTEGSGRAFIADIIPTELRGSAYAVFHTIVGLSVIAGGFSIGRLWDSVSPSFAFQIAAMGSFLAFLVFFSLTLKKHGHEF